MRRWSSALVALVVLAIAAPAFAQQTGSGVLPGSQPLSSGGAFTSPLLGCDGTSSAPCYSFASETNTGVYRQAAQTLGITVAGNLSVTVKNDNGIYLGNDTGLVRSAAGKVTLTGTTPMFQMGGTTSSFPAWKQIGNVMTARLADDSAYATISVNNVTFNGGLFPGGNALLVNAVAPTISSGFGTSPSIANNNGQAAFTINVGTGGTATTGVIGLPTATTGWNCWARDLTAEAAHTADRKTVQTASTTTSATIENQIVSTGAANAWAASDILRVSCFAY